MVAVRPGTAGAGREPSWPTAKALMAPRSVEEPWPWEMLGAKTLWVLNGSSKWRGSLSGHVMSRHDAWRVVPPRGGSTVKRSAPFPPPPARHTAASPSLPCLCCQPAQNPACERPLRCHRARPALACGWSKALPRQQVCMRACSGRVSPDICAHNAGRRRRRSLGGPPALLTVSPHHGTPTALFLLQPCALHPCRAPASRQRHAMRLPASLLRPCGGGGHGCGMGHTPCAPSAAL